MTPDQLFLVTGGGTGAKVAEAFVHLCAAGLGPREAHVLIVDTDTANGNLARAVKTAKSYRAMRRWAWSVQTQAKTSSKWNILAGSEDVGTQLFSTRLHRYQLTKPLQTVQNGGIQNAVSGKTGIQQVVNLLYDEKERESDCRDGFRARPNLGCLLLAEHLEEELLMGEASQFLDALAGAVAQASARVPVVVAASVFGGTGASLLPVAKGCVERALRSKPGMMVDTSKLHWSAVKLLPYYKPAKSEGSVDPDRFLLDTATALQYYSAVYRQANGEAYRGVYVVGSDRPDRNKVAVHTGKGEQSNPGYFEEFLAALAVLDAPRHVAGSSQPVRVFRPDKAKHALQWNDLPHPDGDTLRNRFAYLLHMGAFYHRYGDATLKRGLAQFLRDTPSSEIASFGWFQTVIDRWASQFPTYSGAPKAERPRVIREDVSLGETRMNFVSQDVAEYFGRLLFWAETSLKGEKLELVDYRTANYASLYNGMASLKDGDVDTVMIDGATQTITPEQDNALIRTLRGALATMMRLHHGDVNLKVPVEAFQLVDGKGTIPLSIARPHVEQSLSSEQLPGVADEYTRTAMAMA